MLARQACLFPNKSCVGDDYLEHRVFHSVLNHVRCHYSAFVCENSSGGIVDDIVICKPGLILRPPFFHIHISRVRAQNGTRVITALMRYTRNLTDFYFKTMQIVPTLSAEKNDQLIHRLTLHLLDEVLVDDADLFDCEKKSC